MTGAEQAEYVVDGMFLVGYVMLRLVPLAFVLWALGRVVSRGFGKGGER